MQFKDPTLILIKLVVVTVIIIIILGFLAPYIGTDDAWGDTIGRHEMFTICHNGDYINIRLKPTKKSESIGWLECGDAIITDGREKNGFIHVIEITEYGEGWVYAGYLSDEPPIDNGGSPYYICANGRVACRKSIGGKRRCWADPMETVYVYFWTENWCLTNKGFIQTQYLEPDPI